MKKKTLKLRNFDHCQNFLTILKFPVLLKILQLNKSIHRIKNNYISIQKLRFNSNNLINYLNNNNKNKFQVNTKKELKKR